MIDEDGDIFSYNILGPGNYQKGRVISTGFQGSTSLLAAGNYLGNGSTEMAVLLHSISNFDIAPYYRLLIFKLSSDSINIIYDKAIIDPTTEFNSQFQKTETSIRFADIDNDGNDELIVFDYPYSYILKFINGQNEIISYKENINSSSIFVGDLNKDGVPEVAFPTSTGINFFEFAQSNHASTPYNLEGYSIDSTKIKLLWSGSPGSYLIYKGASQDSLYLYDSTSAEIYFDAVAKTGSNYFYGVRAYDKTKLNPMSNLSQIIDVYSHRPAKITSVKVVSSNNLLITFSSRMNNKIDNLNSFEILNSGMPNSVSAASQFSYLLSFSEAFTIGKNTLIDNNLNDYYGSPVIPDTVEFNIDSLQTSGNFYITNFQIINSHYMAVSFNLDVDSATAVNLDNYYLTPANKVSRVQFDTKNKNTIYLNFDGQKPIGSVGIEYTLHVRNLVSSDETGNIKIPSGAGSYIVLTSFAQNLSDVYVYPSPVRLMNGDSKITFADLPKRARITIYNLSGKRLNQLEETNGDGGLDYNLKDENGNLLPSGIYIYRIERLDDSNNNVEEKLGKFAVIR